VNDDGARARIAGARPEAICVCAFGALIKEPLLSDYWMLNLHPSLLPRWRGAAPIERAIMAGDERTGVSIMRVTSGLDSGPVCAQAEEPIGDDDSYGTLAPRLEALGAELLMGALDERPTCHEQDDALATYADKITADDRALDPNRSAAELERVVRALSPHIGAWVEFDDGTRLGVSEARALPYDAGPPGKLVVLGGGEPALACARGELQLLRVRPPGRHDITGPEWLRGHLR
jgi:methionyl-tRNA formyltransferase